MTVTQETLSQVLRNRVQAEASQWPRLPLLAAVADGTVSTAAFRHYLEQDFIYLQYYARLYARLAALAPESELEHCVRLAHGIFAVELDKHRVNAAAFECDLDGATPSAQTSDYLSFYDSLAGDRAATLVAMLPCLYGYTVALPLVNAPDPDSAYAAWLQVYSGNDFTDFIDNHCEMIDNSVIEQDRALEILERGLSLEISFWNQAAPYLEVAA